MSNRKVCNQLQQIRLKEGYTQQKLADAVCVSRQTIIAIEKGNHSPSLGLALLIAREIKIPLEKLFWLHPQSA